MFSDYSGLKLKVNDKKMFGNKTVYRCLAKVGLQCLYGK